MRGHIISFKSQDHQDITITVRPEYNVELNRTHRDAYVDQIVDALVDCLIDADVHKYQILDTNIGVHMDAHESYYINCRIIVDVLGTAIYYPGKLYGPPEDCYPDDIDDYQYISGFATDCNVNKLKEILDYSVTYFEDITVDIGEPSYESEYEIIEENEY